MSVRGRSVCCWALAGVLLAGAALKMAEPKALAAFLLTLVRLSPASGILLARVVALVEVAVALAVLSRTYRSVGQMAATVMFGSYLLLGIFARLAGMIRPCGCFGALPVSVGGLAHIGLTGVAFGCGTYLVLTDRVIEAWLRKQRTVVILAVMLLVVVAVGLLLFAGIRSASRSRLTSLAAEGVAKRSGADVETLMAVPTRRIGPEKDARLAVPGLEHAMEVVGDTLLVIGDPWNHRILVVDTSGTLRSVFGRKGKGPSEFQSPWSVDFDPGVDWLCVGDPFLGRVSWFTLSGKFVGSFQVVGGLGKDVAVDGRGRVYVADTSFGRLVAVYSREGKLLHRFGEHLPDPHVALLSPAEVQAVTLDVDSDGNCYVAFAFHPEPEVRKYGPDGSLVWSVPFLVPEVTEGIKWHYAHVKGSPAMPIERLRVCRSKVYVATAIIPALYELDCATGRIQRKIRMGDTPMDGSFGPVKVTFSGFAMDGECRLWRACSDIVRFEFVGSAH